jgi:hypothetical protein
MSSIRAAIVTGTITFDTFMKSVRPKIIAALICFQIGKASRVAVEVRHEGPQLRQYHGAFRAVGSAFCRD